MEEKCPVRNPDIVARREKKEALLFNPADGHMLCINGTGMFVWDLCDGSSSGDDIVEKIANVYEITCEKATEDYDRFIKDMEKAGFIGYRT